VSVFVVSVSSVECPNPQLAEVNLARQCRGHRARSDWLPSPGGHRFLFHFYV